MYVYGNFLELKTLNSCTIFENSKDWIHTQSSHCGLNCCTSIAHTYICFTEIICFSKFFFISRFFQLYFPSYIILRTMNIFSFALSFLQHMKNFAFHSKCRKQPRNSVKCIYNEQHKVLIVISILDKEEYKCDTTRIYIGQRDQLHIPTL